MKILKRLEINEWGISKFETTEINEVKLRKDSNSDNELTFINMKIKDVEGEGSYLISLFKSEVEDIINTQITEWSHIEKAYFFNATLVYLKIFKETIYIKTIDLYKGDVRLMGQGWTTIEKLKEILK